MSRLLRLPLAAALFALAAGPAPQLGAAPAPPAPKNVTLPYPAKAPIVVAIQGVERTRERLTQMLKALPPADAAQVKKDLDAGLAELLKDRKLTAIPKDARLFVVVNDITKLFDEQPGAAVLIPVTSYKEFRDTFLTADERKSYEAGKDGVDTIKTAATGVEQVIHLVDLKEYVVATPDRGTAEVYTGKFTRAMTGSMGPDIANSFLAADVALYVNMDVINDLYGDQIRQFKGLIDFALMQAQAGGMLPGVNKKQLDVAKTVIQGVFQGVEDSQGVLVGLEFRPDGLNFRAQVKFIGDSPSGNVLKAETPGPLDVIARLPRSMNSYSGMKFSKKLTDLFGQFTQEFSGAEDDEQLNTQIDKILAEITASGAQGTFSASATPDTSLTVTSYRDAAKAAGAYTQLYKTVPAGGRISNIVLKEKPKVGEKAQTHRGFTFTEVRLVFDFEATVKDFPDNVRETTLNSLKRNTTEKATQWIGTDGKVVVHLGAKDWETARNVLNEYLDGSATLGSAPGYKTTRKGLPDEANMIMLLETGELIVTLLEQAKGAADAIPGGGGLPPIGNVKPIKGEPTYVGVAVTLKPEVASLDVFVPGTGLNVAARMLAPLFKNVD